MMKKVVHITAVHSEQDSRIFYRQCIWLAQHHYDVTYVVPAEAVPGRQAGTRGTAGDRAGEAGSRQAGDKGTAESRVGSAGRAAAGEKAEAGDRVAAGGRQGGVGIERVKKPGTRLGRPLVWFRILAKVAKLQPDILHFHDPELLVMAPLFKLFCGRQCRLVYDVHEYVAASIRDKFWIPEKLRAPAAWGVTFLERVFSQWVDGQVFVVKGQVPFYKNWKTRKIVLHNYPDLDNFAVSAAPGRQDRQCGQYGQYGHDGQNGQNGQDGQDGQYRQARPFTLVHIGSLYERRGIMTMLQALVLLKQKGYFPRLILGGVFESALFRNRVDAFIQENGLSGQVRIFGWIGYRDIRSYLEQSDAVWLPHHPTAQHARESVCTKQVEAMVAGLPAIVSDIPSLTRFVHASRGGLAVSPLDPAAHAGAVKWLMDHPKAARDMGIRAGKMARERYVWQQEAPLLTAFYDALVAAHDQVAERKMEQHKEISRGKTVLVISNRFPPHGGAGVQRTVKFVKYLPAYGWRVQVLTTGAGWSLSDESLMADIDSRTRVKRVNGLVLSPRLPFGFRRIIAQWILVVDQELGWVPAAVFAGYRMIQKNRIDIIYSTAAPYSNHLAAFFLKRATGLPWVADFRDPWIRNLTSTFPTPIHRFICTCLEAKIVSRADRVVSVSDPMTRDFQKRYRRKKDNTFITIANGFDRDDFLYPDPKDKDEHRFTMVYAGSFYQTRTPDTFLDGIKILKDQGIISCHNFCIRFVGSMGKSVKDAVKERGLEKIVVFTGYLPHKISISHVLAADALLLVINTGDNVEGVFTGKLFEYLASARPILALAPEGCAAQLVEKAGAGYVVSPDNHAGVADAIEKMVNQWRAGRPVKEPAAQVVQQYDRRILTGRLARAFDRLVAAPCFQVFFITSWYPTQENSVQGIFVQAHAKAVANRHRVCILHCRGADFNMTCRWECQKMPAAPDQIPVHQLRYKQQKIPGATYMLFLAGVIQAVRLLAKETRPDILHVHMYNLAIPAILLGKLMGIPVVLTEHASVFARSRMTAKERLKAKIAFGYADICLPVSRFLQRQIVSHGIQGRFHVIENAVDTSVFTTGHLPEHPHGKQKMGSALTYGYKGRGKNYVQEEYFRVRILFVGMIGASKIKGLHHLFAALAELKKSDCSFICQVIGDAGEISWCRSLHHTLGLGSRVVFCGVLPKADIARHMQTADFLVVPSLVETFSVVTMEALCCGLPVLCTRCGGPEELVTEDCGVLVEPDDSQALYAGILAMIEKGAAFDRRAIARYARNRCSQENVGKKINRVYQSVAAPQRNWS